MRQVGREGTRESDGGRIRTNIGRQVWKCHDEIQYFVYKIEIVIKDRECNFLMEKIIK